MPHRRLIGIATTLVLFAGPCWAGDSVQALAERLTPRLEEGWWDRVFADWDREEFIARHAQERTSAEVDVVKIDGILNTHDQQKGRTGVVRSGLVRFVGRRVIDGEDGWLFRVDHRASADFLHLTLLERDGEAKWVDLRGLDDGRALSISVRVEEDFKRLVYAVG